MISITIFVSTFEYRLSKQITAASIKSVIWNMGDESLTQKMCILKNNAWKKDY